MRPPTTRCRFGDVVIVPFSFSDQRGRKRRPAVVVSSDAYNADRADVIIMAVTSRLPSEAKVGDSMIEDWSAGDLLSPSAGKPVMTTTEQTLVLHALGRGQSGNRIQCERRGGRAPCGAARGLEVHGSKGDRNKNVARQPATKSSAPCRSNCNTQTVDN